MQLIRYSRRLTTEFRVIQRHGDVVTTSRLLAAPDGNNERWTVRRQTHVHDHRGGASALDPFRNAVRLRDWWNGYRDYTLSRDAAIAQLENFEATYPDVSREWSRLGRIPHVSTAARRDDPAPKV